MIPYCSGDAGMGDTQMELTLEEGGTEQTVITFQCNLGKNDNKNLKQTQYYFHGRRMIEQTIADLIGGQQVDELPED